MGRWKIWVGALLTAGFLLTGGRPCPPTRVILRGTIAKVDPEAKTLTVKLGQSAALGKFLTDEQGFTLYVFMNDPRNTSTCEAECAQRWPPFLTAGKPLAGPGVNAALLGTIRRKDGTTQVTYNGHPLYYFSGDAKPGDTNGQGFNNLWYVIGPDGMRSRSEGKGMMGAHYPPVSHIAAESE